MGLPLATVLAILRYTFTNRRHPVTWVTYLGAVLCLFAFAVSAAPVVNLPTPQHASGAFSQPQSIELREHWQAGLFSVPAQSTRQGSDPQLLWAAPDAQFPERGDQSPWLSHVQRYVARVSLISNHSGPSMHLHAGASRLDAVHVSYRWDKGPWRRLVAGDTIAMSQWPVVGNAANFSIERRVGQIDMVVEYAHSGSADTQLRLHLNDGEYAHAISEALVVGLLGGMFLVLALSGLWAALSFGRLGFLAITMLGLTGAGLVAAHSGMLGVYAFTNSDTFSDEIKVVINLIWCALLPWATAVMLHTRYYAPNWWRASWVWLILLSGLSFWLKSHQIREMTLAVSIVLALLCAGYALILVALAAVRQHRIEWTAPSTVLLFSFTLLAPILTLHGWIGNPAAFFISTCAALGGMALMLHTLVQQHRIGHMVSTRARASYARDVLTGLLNRAGFEKRLARELQSVRLAQLPGCGFMYVTLGEDTDELRREHGLQGFEVGMVQIAAALAAGFSTLDAIGRVGPSAFAVAMPGAASSQATHATAQRMLAQLIKLAEQAAPLAYTARIAVAWLNTKESVELDELELGCQQALAELDAGKRITSIDADAVKRASSPLPVGETIDDLARQMLGPDTTQLRSTFEQTAIELDNPVSGERRVAVPRTRKAQSPD